MLIGVLGFILGEEFFSMSNICFLDPFILGVRITFPCDEVFCGAAFSSGIQNCLDFPFFFSFDDVGGVSQVVWSMFGSGLVWC